MSKKNSIRGWLIVAVMFTVMMFVFATSISCFGIYVKPVSEEFGIPRTTFSLTVTISSLAMLVSAILAGSLLEKYSLKLQMILGVAACGLSMLIYATASSIYFFYVAAVIMGTAISFTCNIPIAILVKNWFNEKRKGLAVSLSMIGAGAGAMLLTPLYTHVIETYGWRQSFWLACACILLIVLPLVIIVVKEYPVETVMESKGSKSKEKTGITLKKALCFPATWIVFIAYIVTVIINMSVLSNGIAFMTDGGMSPAKAASAISIASGVLIAGKLITGGMDGVIGTRRTTTVCTIVTTIAFISFWWLGETGSTLAMIIFVVCYGLGLPVATVTMPMVISEMFGDGNMGTIMGFFCMTAGIGGMLQVFPNMIYDRTGSYSLAWMIITALSIAAIFAFALCVKPQKGKA